MANLFINLPPPAGNGVGATTDVSTMGAEKTITVTGAAECMVTIEFSNDATIARWAPVHTFQGSVGGKIVVILPARRMRVRLSGYKSGTPNIDVGSTDLGSQFATPAVPAGNGVGAATNISGLGTVKTILAAGPYDGVVIPELSEDNIDWVPFSGFQGGTAFNTRAISAQFLRVRRTGVPVALVSGPPVVSIGAGNDTAGSSGGGGNYQAFTYIVTGLEVDPADFFVPLPAVRANDAYKVQATFSGASIPTVLDLPNLAGADRTTTQFRLTSSLALTAGDQIDFIVIDAAP